MDQIPSTDVSRQRPAWTTTPILVMCVVCLAAGIAAGYFLQASAPVPAQAGPTSSQSPSPSQTAAQPAEQMRPEKMPTLDEMKHMADSKAAPLLAKLNSDEKNPQLLNQIGLIYESTHQFKEAAGYFQKALQYDSRNIGIRADYASCLYYTGDVDGALAQLNQSLSYDPKHVGTLFNIGMIRWKGKNDVDGAVAAWQQLLQYHPDLPQKDTIEHMIKQAKVAKTSALANKGQG